MKLISWNVNGIRACLKKGFENFVQQEQPDMLAIQETKAHQEQVDPILDNYHQFWNSAEKKGYSGTAIFTKIPPLNVTYDMGIEEHDKEGRVIALEFPHNHVVTVYTPNAKRGLERLVYRQQWDKDFLNYVKTLEKTKPVIFCGDLNVAHTEIDLKNAKSNKTTATKPGNAGFTDQERAGFQNILDAGFHDTFRLFNKEPNNYTWWSYMFNARKNNVGWRIDYFMTSELLQHQIKEATILPQIMGSDHCPVSLTLL